MLSTAMPDGSMTTNRIQREISANGCQLFRRANPVSSHSTVLPLAEVISFESHQIVLALIGTTLRISSSCAILASIQMNFEEVQE